MWRGILGIMDESGGGVSGDHGGIKKESNGVVDDTEKVEGMRDGDESEAKLFSFSTPIFSTPPSPSPPHQYSPLFLPLHFHNNTLHSSYPSPSLYPHPST
ncbi:hypothetical protein Pmani_026228 [Petrolisthes manimaculis]|uniref:Uncharacterized protein n=1 Tax=Petrolisthes manimaculis TaxID=1843537 RepID=A0AAE1U0A1_9EUCA|nr:hypothetical protein Pmani_026228 [Petrolisthes manimaculis]